MISTDFVSTRNDKHVTVILTMDKTHYITEDDEVISIERDSCWHLNDDGLLRAEDFYNDPRFDYWVNMEYEFCK